MDLARAGVNLAANQTEIYSIPFNMCGSNYDLKYKIGQKQRMGILEDFRMWGDISISLHTVNIKDCYKMTVLMERFAKFVGAISNVYFERITLSFDEFPAAEFYYKCVSDNQVLDLDMLFTSFPS